MKAIAIKQFGEAEDVFEQVELETPVAGPGEVVIRVRASSVNPIDTKIRSGAVAAVAPAFPAVLHGDVAGIVEQVGPGVAQLRIGDEVYACAGGVKGSGGASAELMVADADLVAPKPTSLDMVEAGVLPLVGITTWEALIERAQVKPGQRVLVHGGAGGVGHIGVQLAKACGAVVCVTISSDAKARIAAECGADATVNYQQESVEQYVQQHTNGDGFDVVFDTVGGDNLANSFAAARAGGAVVTIAARTTQDLSPMHGKGLTLHCVFMLLPLLTGRDRARHGGILRSLGRLVDAGRIRPVMEEQTFGFTRVGDAHRKLEAGTAVGKIALTSDL